MSAQVAPDIIIKVEESTKDKIRRKKIRISPGWTLFVFDIIFFAYYALGWIFTAIFNPDAINDNAVTRAFGVYNICIGVDSMPARPIAAIMFTFAFIFYGATIFIHAVRTKLTKDVKWRYVRAVLLVLSLCLGSVFTLTLAVPPDSPSNAKIHVLAFSIGLFGYSLLKIFGTIEYFEFRDIRFFSKQTWIDMPLKHRVYCIAEIIQFLVFFMFSIFLFYMVCTMHWKAIFLEPVPDSIEFDYKGGVLIIAAFFGPIVVYKTNPEKRSITLLDED